MNIPVYNMSGEVVRNIDISDAVFAQPVNEALVHQALLAQHANARQGTSDTKTRSEVVGSVKKLYRQKGTGRARPGSIRSGVRRGGGVIFGPHPRDISVLLPKKMRRAAIRSVLSAKVSEQELMVLDELRFDAPKTSEMFKVIRSLGIDGKAIVALSEMDEAVVKSARNLQNVKTMPAKQLNVTDMLAYDKLLMTEAALRQIEELWGGAA
ncbi:MAG: 50S ribosomal protein L4 [Dehalococcoidia bacterium]|nr:50S ribosomal protein L4 [Dehalococcoidia bacterium]